MLAQILWLYLSFDHHHSLIRFSGNKHDALLSIWWRGYEDGETDSREDEGIPCGSRRRSLEFVVGDHVFLWIKSLEAL